jgi:hypothetical protein
MEFHSILDRESASNLIKTNKRQSESIFHREIQPTREVKFKNVWPSVRANGKSASKGIQTRVRPTTFIGDVIFIEMK